MTCCDDFGNCTQGRDCPCRKDVYKDDMNELVKEIEIFCGLALVVIVTILVAILVQIYGG